MSGPRGPGAADYSHRRRRLPDEGRQGACPVWALWAAGGLSALVYAWLAFAFESANGAGPVAAFLAAFAVLFVLYGAAARWGGGGLAAILAFAALFRLLLLFAGLPPERPLAALRGDLSGQTVGYQRFLLYDNDVWRYLWDGHMTVSGPGPYALPPSEVAERAAAGLAPYAGLLEGETWWDVLDNVSFQTYDSVYPPLAQGLFGLSRLLAPASVAAWKLLVIVCDLATCLVLVRLLAALGLRRRRVLLYAWNPLVLKELAGSGHADVLMVLLLTAAVLLLVRGRQGAALAALAASALAKLATVALVPLFLARTRPRLWPWLLAAGAVGWVPFLGQLGPFFDGLAVYGREWSFNSGPWAAAARLGQLVGLEQPAAWATAVTRLALAAWLVALAWRSRRLAPRQLPQAAFTALAAVVLLHPAVMPWYLLWALPLAVVAGARWWLVFTALSMLSYLVYVDQSEHAWWLWLEYGGLLAAWVVERGRRRLR